VNLYLGKVKKNCRNYQCKIWIGNNRYWHPFWWSNIYKVIYVWLWQKETLEEKGTTCEEKWIDLFKDFCEKNILFNLINLLNLCFASLEHRLLLNDCSQLWTIYEPWTMVACWKELFKSCCFEKLILYLHVGNFIKKLKMK
jgi:hypothetical protein